MPFPEVQRATIFAFRRLERWRVLRWLVWVLVGFPLAAATQVSRPYEGITLVNRSEAQPRPLRMKVALVDLTAPGVRFRLTAPGNSPDTVPQTTLDFLRQERAQLAVNAHFYLESVGSACELVGLAVSDGRVISGFEPQPVVPNGLDQGYAIVPFAPALNLDPTNRASVVHWNPEFPDRRHIREDVVLWNTVSGSAQIITAGTKMIPQYAAGPDGLRPLLGYSAAFSWYDRKRARTILGLADAGRTLVIFTVDEYGGSEGMTVGEAADLLIADYRVTDAINLDGGPSTSLAMEDPVTRRSSLLNVPSGLRNGNVVGSNLAIFARPKVPPLRAEAATPGGLRLSWPADTEAWRLEQCDAVEAQSWFEVAQPAVASVEGRAVMLPVSESIRFYRLREVQ